MRHLLDELLLERQSIVESMVDGGYTLELAQAAAAVQGTIAAVEAEMKAKMARDKNRPVPLATGEDGWPLDDKNKT